MKRLLVAAMSAALLLTSVASLWAQDVTTIPVESMANPIALSPDDHTLATYNHYAIYDEAPTPDLISITLLDIDTGESIGSLSGYSDWVTDVDFNADGSQLVSYHRNGDLILWDMATQQALKTIQTYALGGGWVQFLADGKTVAYRASEYAIGLLDTESGAITRLFGRHMDSYDAFIQTYATFPGRGDVTLSWGQVSPDGRWLVASTGNDELIRWAIASGEVEPTTLREPSEKPAMFAIRGLVFAPDGSSATYFDQNDNKLHTWDVAAGSEIASYAGGEAFALSKDGMQVAWADRAEKEIYLADTANPDAATLLFTLPEALRVAPGVTGAAFTSDGKRLVVGGFFASEGENTIYVFDVAG